MADNSFLPEDYVEKRLQRRTNAFCVVLFAVVMAGVVASFVVTGRQHAEVRELKDDVHRQFHNAAQLLDQLEKLQQQKQQMVRKAKVTGMLLERVPRSLVLAELINNMPPTLSLLEIFADTKQVEVRAPVQTAMQQARVTRQAAAAPAEPQIIPTEVTLVLIGVAPTDVEVAQYMGALGRSPMFTGVDLKFSEQTQVEGRVMRRFRVELKIPHDLEPQALDPTFVRRHLKQNPMDDTIQIHAYPGDPANASDPDSIVVPTGDR
jgi:hypothetical protein